MRYLVRKERQGAFVFDRTDRNVSAMTEDEWRQWGNLSDAEVIAPPFSEDQINHEHALVAPNRLYLELTRRCRLRCKMCYNAAMAALPNELTTPEWIQLLDQMATIGVFEARFTGGEPTEHPEFFRLLDAAIERGFYVSVASHGVWNPQTRQRICKRRIDDVIFSLDGPEKINDEFRSRGSYVATVDSILCLKDAGFPKVRLNCVVTKMNWRSVEALFMLCRDLDLLLIDFIHPRPFGRGSAEASKALMLSDRETYEFNVWVAELRAKYPTVKVVMDFDLLSTVETPRHPIVPRIHACPAGREFAFVSPQGYLFPCGVAPVYDIDRMSEQEKQWFVAGNVREHFLLELWQNAPVWKAYRDLRECKPDKCFNCRFWGKRCFGTCPVGAYYATGRLNGEDPYCYSRFLEAP